MKKSERTQATIINTATKLFAIKGYTATSTREIAQTAGVSEASIFKYFISKEKLLRHIVNGLVPLLHTISKKELMKLIKQESTIYDCFQEILKNRMDFILSHHLTLKVIFQETLINDRLNEHLILNVWPDVKHTLSEIFQYGINQGDIKDLDVDLLVSTFASLVTGPILASFLDSSFDKDELQVMITQQFDIFYNGISTKKEV